MYSEPPEPVLTPRKHLRSWMRYLLLFFGSALLFLACAFAAALAMTVITHILGDQWTILAMAAATVGVIVVLIEWTSEHRR